MQAEPWGEHAEAPRFPALAGLAAALPPAGEARPGRRCPRRRRRRGRGHPGQRRALAALRGARVFKIVAAEDARRRARRLQAGADRGEADLHRRRPPLDGRPAASPPGRRDDRHPQDEHGPRLRRRARADRGRGRACSGRSCSSTCRTTPAPATKQWTFSQKQTGADKLTIGGSLSANIHGRGLALPPFISDIESFKLLNARGDLLQCSRTRATRSCSASRSAATACSASSTR